MRFFYDLQHILSKFEAFVHDYSISEKNISLSKLFTRK